MQIHKDFHSLTNSLNYYRQEGKRIAFVPTMGCLHYGHVQLINEARALSDISVASIFVNPTQFGPDEDLQKYPRPLKEDQQLLRENGIDHLLLPDFSAIYTRPIEKHTIIHVPYISDILCGATRKGHFDGACTIVLKLLLAVRPHQLILGEKDYQQLMVIQYMIEDLGLDVDLIGVPTVREEDGLAYSSRNRYLSNSERARAPALYKSLLKARALWMDGQRNTELLKKHACHELSSQVSSIEYWTVCALPDLIPLSGVVPPGTDTIICACVSIGNTRLIDNIRCGNIQNL